MLKDELSRLEMTITTDSLGIVRFRREVIQKNKYLVDELSVLQNTINDDKASREGVEEELTQLRSLVAVCDGLAAKFTEEKTSLEVIRAEVELLKGRVERADTEKADYDKLVAEVGEQSERHIVHLNVALVGDNLAEKLRRFLVTEAVNAVDSVVQQLGYDAVSRLLLGRTQLYACRAP